MTYEAAKAILDGQGNSLRRIRDIRFVLDGYEYRVDYLGGLAAYIVIDRRKVGKRSFEYFAGVSGAYCVNAQDAMDLVMKKVRDKLGKGDAK